MSNGLYRAVLSKSVLTLSRDYFRLRKPLERRLYELARKHCGRQRSWQVSVETLLKKTGSNSPRRVFRKMIRDIIAADHLPDYQLVEERGDIIRVTARDAVLEPGITPSPSPDALEAARALMPGMDVYALVADWQSYWQRKGQQRLRSVDAAFLGFVKARSET